MGYKILILGKNGEPLKDLFVLVSVTKNWFSEPIEEELISNEHGEIIINDSEYEDITYISVENSSDKRVELLNEWSLNYLENKKVHQYENFNFKEFHEFSIPYYKDSFIPNEIHFYKFNTIKNRVIS